MKVNLFFIILLGLIFITLGSLTVNDVGSQKLEEGIKNEFSEIKHPEILAKKIGDEITLLDGVLGIVSNWYKKYVIYQKIEKAVIQYQYELIIMKVENLEENNLQI